MSEPTKAPSAKRLRLTNESEQSPCDVTKPGNEPTNTGDGEGPLPVERIDIKSFLLDFIQTETGADDLANALTDRHIRGVLKKRGLRVNADDDIGYNSLPLELRDQIRAHVITDFNCNECDESRHKCCPRLSTYACIDAEWQAAVEPITFQSIRMKRTIEELKQDLDFFFRHVVGNRRQYLQQVTLPCILPWDIESCYYEVEQGGIYLSPIQQLFNGMRQWPQAAMLDRDFELRMSWVELPSPTDETRYTEDMQIMIAGLPTVSQFTSLKLGNAGQIRAEVLLVLLRRLPRLQHISIAKSSLDFMSHGYGSNHLRATRLQRKYSQCHTCRVFSFEAMFGQLNLLGFFTNLSNTIPNLESMRVATWMEYMEDSGAKYRSILMSYSQRLQRLCLTNKSYASILDCFAPFHAENFDPDASFPLFWSNLTHFSMKVDHDDGKFHIQEMRDLVLAVGRAIRCMPRIQLLIMQLSYMGATDAGDEAEYIHFQLKVFWDDRSNGSGAAMYVRRIRLDNRDEYGASLDVIRAVIPGEARELWKESLLKGANAILDVHVEEESDSDEDTDL